MSVNQRLAPIPSPKLLTFLRQHVKQGDSILDLGCGNKWCWSTIQMMQATVLGVDAYEPFGPDFILDLETHPLPFHDGAFDIVLVLDVIEHLTREGGERLLERCKEITRDKVIMLTPLIWSTNVTEDPNSEYYSNPFNLHKSLWKLSDFEGGRWTQYHIWKGVKRYLGIWRKG